MCSCSVYPTSGGVYCELNGNHDVTGLTSCRLGRHVVDSKVQRLVVVSHGMARNSRKLDVSHAHPFNKLLLQHHPIANAIDLIRQSDSFDQLWRRAAYPGRRDFVSRGLCAYSMADGIGILGCLDWRFPDQPLLQPVCLVSLCIARADA